MTRPDNNNGNGRNTLKWVPLGLVVTICGGAIGYGELRERGVRNSERIQTIETIVRQHCDEQSRDMAQILSAIAELKTMLRERNVK